MIIEDWWVAVLWVADDDGVVSCRAMAPAAGPPPGSPLARLGPLLSGSLAGFVLEEEGRQQLRLRLPIPPAAPDRPWTAPLLVQVALRWEPARATTFTEAGLAEVALAAFRRSVEAARRA